MLGKERMGDIGGSQPPLTMDEETRVPPKSLFIRLSERLFGGAKEIVEPDPPSEGPQKLSCERVFEGQADAQRKIACCKETNQISGDAFDRCLGRGR
jgi:hypothetical protein